MSKNVKLYIAIAVLVVIAIVSFAVISPIAASSDFHADSIEYLDQQKNTVMTLTAMSTAASGVISLIPGDGGTPIAEKLADLSFYFMIALTAIFLEKYLLTLTGFAAFKILIPLACLCGIGGLAARNRSVSLLARKIALFAVAIVLIVPVSIQASKMIETTYGFSIEDTEEFAEEAADTADQEFGFDESEAESDGFEGSGQEEEESSGLWTGILHMFSGAAESISSSVDSVVSSGTETITKMQTLLNSMIEKMAVLIVTTCIIPVLVLAAFYLLLKSVLGVDLRLEDFRKKEESL